MSGVVVASLHLHPVKSCAGLGVSRARLDAFGFVGDRRFLVVDERDVFLTQRDAPALARIRAALEDHTLILQASGQQPLIANASDAGPAREVTIWRDRVTTRDTGDAAAAWISAVLGRPGRLVTCGSGFTRPVRGGAAQTGDQVGFADAHPLLVLSEASLEHLNARLDEPLPVNRFRPNIVLHGCGVHDEDRWRRIRIGGVVLRASGACARCVITTSDQETLERGREPLRTLAMYRRNAVGEVCFGQNYINESKDGYIEVGQTVEVLEVTP